jgi:hypothetical protein
MGCDIHAAIEFKQNGKWHAQTRPNPYVKYNTPETPPDEREPDVTARLHFGRNYDAFAILANVRNGHGFAGIKTGDCFTPLSDGRGLPHDITEAGKHACSGEHSETWISLKELLDYDWTEQIKHQGYVDVEVFEKWDRVKQWTPRPSEYCGGIGGASVAVESEDKMRQIVESIVGGKSGNDWTEAIQTLKKLHPHTYCLVHWQESCADAAGELWTKVVPEMLRTAKDVGIDNVRMVMNFDS